MANPKHDYDSQEFYQQLEKFASVCFFDKDVATLLDLDEDVFGSMKNGNYANWTSAQNKRRSERINRVLARARSGARMQVWNSLLRLGVGAAKVKSRSVRAPGTACDCQGKRPNCPHCGGLGYVKLTEDVIITESESDIAPSMQALTTWLYHHDPEYRRVQRGEEPSSDVAQIDGGVNIDAWLRREIETTANDISQQEEEGE